ncbi:MAG: metallophosphoesterase [Spirochaetales bacterium]|nr:metallophosphoesterase [Spirochaetales bacterium]
MKPNKIVQTVVFLFFTGLYSCATGPQFSYTNAANINNFPVYPDTSFAVITDLHMHTASLGKTGPDFTGELKSGKKMLHLAEEIAEALADTLAADNSISFVLVCGDLTRDGEKENHLAMQKVLAKIKAAGKQVFVVPGNHDINNFDARRFTQKGSEQVTSISAAEFEDIYNDFGFSQAIARDPASLSYIVEPVPGLWLFALDACTYTKNKQGSPNSTFGEFTPETLDWIEQQLIEAQKLNKAVLGMMHHGILEHFETQKKYFRDFVVNDYQPVSKMFAHYGMKLVFTGHFHALDITKQTWRDTTFLYDIETSSMVTFPAMYRQVRVLNNSVQIQSLSLEALPSIPDFPAYAKKHLSDGVTSFLQSTLSRYDFEQKDYEILIPQMVAGMVAHTAGDEMPPPVLLNSDGLSFKAGLVICFAQDLIKGVWHDLPPADKKIVIELSTGTWKNISGDGRQ